VRLYIHYGDYYHRQYHGSIAGPQKAKFNGGKYVSTKKPQYKRARENLWLYSIHRSRSTAFPPPTKIRQFTFTFSRNSTKSYNSHYCTMLTRYVLHTELPVNCYRYTHIYWNSADVVHPITLENNAWWCALILVAASSMIDTDMHTGSLPFV